MSNQRNLAPIIIVLIIIAILFGGILVYQYWWIPKEEAKMLEEKSVLCRAQYSASIGGENEPIADVTITTEVVDAEIQAPIVYITDAYGQGIHTF